MSLLEAEQRSGVLDRTEFMGHGLYLILQRHVPDARFPRTWHEFSAWLERTLSLPYAEIHITERRHFGEATLSVQLAPRPPRPGSPSDVSAWHGLGDRHRQLALDVARATPGKALYCGETHCFLERIREHLSGSEVLDRIRALGYDTADLDFSWLPLPTVEDPLADNVVSFRRLLEDLVTRMTLAPQVLRPGGMTSPA